MEESKNPTPIVESLGSLPQIPESPPYKRVRVRVWLRVTETSTWQCLRSCWGPRLLPSSYSAVPKDGARGPEWLTPCPHSSQWGRRKGRWGPLYPEGRTPDQSLLLTHVPLARTQTHKLQDRQGEDASVLGSCVSRGRPEGLLLQEGTMDIRDSQPPLPQLLNQGLWGWNVDDPTSAGSLPWRSGAPAMKHP